MNTLSLVHKFHICIATGLTHTQLGVHYLECVCQLFRSTCTQTSAIL